jgi:uncharacterized membrane protein
MLEVLKHLFSCVCGQNPDHTWLPGGVALPCCQRCLGLYAGAAVAAALNCWLRPRLTGGFLKWHACLLLLMAPFGFHWVPQDGILRTMSGVWFGAAVVAFLRAGAEGALLGAWRYWLGLLAGLFGIPLAAACGGAITATVLSAMAALGLAVLGCLVAANLADWMAGALRLFGLPARRLKA